MPAFAAGLPCPDLWRALRPIEGENPALPLTSEGLHRQLLASAVATNVDGVILLTVRRGGAALYSDAVPLTGMRRGADELLRWLFAAMDFPVGVVLLSGTSIVPPTDFPLRAGDDVVVDVPGIGTLSNPVCQVGRPVPAGSETAS